MLGVHSGSKLLWIVEVQVFTGQISCHLFTSVKLKAVTGVAYFKLLSQHLSQLLLFILPTCAIVLVIDCDILNFAIFAGCLSQCAAST